MFAIACSRHSYIGICFRRFEFLVEHQCIVSCRKNMFDEHSTSTKIYICLGNSRSHFTEKNEACGLDAYALTWEWIDENWRSATSAYGYKLFSCLREDSSNISNSPDHLSQLKHVLYSFVLSIKYSPMSIWTPFECSTQFVVFYGFCIPLVMLLHARVIIKLKQRTQSYPLYKTLSNWDENEWLAYFGCDHSGRLLVDEIWTIWICFCLSLVFFLLSLPPFVHSNVEMDDIIVLISDIVVLLKHHDCALCFGYHVWLVEWDATISVRDGGRRMVWHEW